MGRSAGRSKQAAMLLLLWSPKSLGMGYHCTIASEGCSTVAGLPILPLNTRVCCGNPADRDACFPLMLLSHSMKLSKDLASPYQLTTQGLPQQRWCTHIQSPHVYTALRNDWGCLLVLPGERACTFYLRNWCHWWGARFLQSKCPVSDFWSQGIFWQAAGLPHPIHRQLSQAWSSFPQRLQDFAVPSYALNEYNTCIVLPRGCKQIMMRHICTI